MYFWCWPCNIGPWKFIQGQKHTWRFRWSRWSQPHLGPDYGRQTSPLKCGRRSGPPTHGSRGCRRGSCFPSRSKEVRKIQPRTIYTFFSNWSINLWLGNNCQLTWRGSRIFFSFLIRIPVFWRRLKPLFIHERAADTFRFWHFLILTLSNSDTCQFWHLPILTLSNSDTFQFWHFPILTLANSETFQFWPLPILTLSNSDTFQFWHLPILTLALKYLECIKVSEVQNPPSLERWGNPPRLGKKVGGWQNSPMALVLLHTMFACKS